MNIKIYLLVLLAYTGSIVAADGKDIIQHVSPLFQKEIDNQPNGNGFQCMHFNKKGEAAWHEQFQYQSGRNCYFWSKDSGLVKIALYDHLITLGYVPYGIWNNFIYYPIHIDDNGNVFLNIECSKDSARLNAKTKLGIWNVHYGFKLIEISEMDCIGAVSFTEKNILIQHQNGNHFVLIDYPTNLWTSKPIEDLQKDTQQTPWDTMTMGSAGSRLYAMSLLHKQLKNCKDKESHRTLAVIIQAEAAHVLDSLQAEAKLAKSRSDTARAKGTIDVEADKTYTKTNDQIKALKAYLKDLSISDSGIFKLDLPSKKWTPN